MSSFAFLLLCMQACLIQFAVSCPTAYPSVQYYGASAPIIPCGSAASLANSYSAGSAYSGSGAGNVNVAGSLDVNGVTRVFGVVPVLGSVRFSGQLPAYGSGTTSGSCGCGCA